jgi:hypothetical protein
MHAIAQIYKRAYALIRDWPYLLLIPLVAEFAQHAVEIRLGMYAGSIDAAGSRLRLAFGIIKVAAIFCTLLAAWRFWRFNGDKTRALRPTRLLLRGIAVFVCVQIMGDLVAIGTGRGLIALAHEPSRSTQTILFLAPLLVWLLASAALIPWYVGMATEDLNMTLRRTLHASRNHLATTWGLLAAGSLPLMIVHYALGYAGMRGAPAWPLMIIDAGIVALLAASLAATYYTIYQRAEARTGAPAPV